MNDLRILLDKTSESFYHKSIKQLIFKYVSERNFNIAESSTEKYFKNRRADVYFKLKNGQKIVVEIQQSRISIKEIIKRTREYNQQKIYVLWILHGKGKCVATPKFPEDKRNVRINPVEKFLHKMYGGRVYYVNVTNSKSKITAPYALHYSLSDKKTDELIRSGFDYYYFRNSNFTFIPNWNLLCTNFNNFKIARFYDKNVKNSLKNLILSYIQIYLKENPYDYKKYRKTKKLIKNVIKEFKSKYGKSIIIDCIKLINKKGKFLNEKAIQIYKKKR
ncbi:MAG: hypothetical protein EU540_05540 [Promethearchaeota archaeon]|nr:MAG: hypothetical protein EU540_05540 [Candidatus Lokiarchaeota archaeon]